MGVLTGMKPNVFSSSVNFRVSGEGSLWTNVKKALTSAWPVGFLLRDTLEKEASFDAAVSRLASSTLIAPVYFTCAGTKKDEGALITRSVSTEHQRWTMREHGIIVQTNVDHYMNEDDEGSFDIMVASILAYYR